MFARKAENGTVLVLGGSGFYGRYLVDDLLEHTDARVVVASRNPTRDRAWGSRVTTAICDVRGRDRLEELLAGCDIVVHCAGPFQYLPLAPVRAAIATGTPYVDIAEDRHFAREVRSLDAEVWAAGIAAQKLLQGRPVKTGVVPVHRWSTSRELVDELRRRDFRLWWQPPGASRWRPFVLDELQ